MNACETRRSVTGDRVQTFGKDTADKLRAWENASHIERAPQREKMPAPAPANPPK
ncbi:MAG: hypothetical protein K1X78_18245 [Verrucomicrobiaceae bacterium]|nr:hypothetical protein [Verrucomicrobiaceae bacterium]